MSNRGGRLSFFPARTGELEADDFFSYLLTGWKRAGAAQNFDVETVKRRVRVVQRLADFCGKYPWEWDSKDADEWFEHLRDVRLTAKSTRRAYQSDLELFCDFVGSPHYTWNQECIRRFGQGVTQIINDLNKAHHTQEAGSEKQVRPHTIEELQAVLDFADDEVERRIRSGRKGALSLWRDAVAFKVAYAWGLRAQEVTHLRVSDFHYVARAPAFGDYGAVRIRNGKAAGGQPPKPRIVLTIHGWAAEALDDWITHGLPRYGTPVSDLFPTSTGGVLDEKKLWERLSGYYQELGLDPGLDLHSLRRAYATHCEFEYGYPLKWISMQLGHVHESTTTTYTHPSADYAFAEMERVLGKDLLASGGKLQLKRTPRTRKGRR